MSGTSTELHRLNRALGPRPPADDRLGRWRWTVRQRMAGLRDALAAEHDHPADGWLAARRATVVRERNSLLARLAELGPQVLESPDVVRVHADLRRLVTDVTHHRQRLHDLAYDEVELELGGSE